MASSRQSKPRYKPVDTLSLVDLDVAYVDPQDAPQLLSSSSSPKSPTSSLPSSPTLSPLLVTDLSVLEFLQQNVAPYILSLWITVGALVDPDNNHPMMRLLGHAFVLTFMVWLVFTIVYIGERFYRLGWFRMIKDIILDYWIVVWKELKLIKNYYWFKAIVGIISIVLIILMLDLTQHLDIFDVLHQVADFIARAARALFYVDDIIRLVHELVNKAFLRWFITPLRLLLIYARSIVQDSLLYGSMLIILLLVMIPLMVTLFRMIKSWSTGMINTVKDAIEEDKKALFNSPYNNRH